MKTKKRNLSGFTLIELMMAMVVLAIGLTAVVHMTLVTMRGNAYAREVMEAYQIAQAAMEELKVRAMTWVKFSGDTTPGYVDDTSARDLYDVLPASSVVDMPPGGTDLQWTDVRSLISLHGKPIASGTSVADSSTINVHGDSASGRRRIYRVHYVANWVPAEDGDPGNSTSNLLKITVFVSWDNKDYGDSNSTWGTIENDGSNFWDRHMVALSEFLSATYFWSEGR